MIKMIITCRRNPALSRSEFFHHLRHVHWPLIQRHPEVLAALPVYVQNHSVLPGDKFEPAAPYRIAVERDSVIELWFDGIEGIDRILSIPAYLQYIRPDEAAFNDLPENIMLLTDASTVFRAASIGRCKRFDFIRRSADVDADTFVANVRNRGRALALDPLYTGHVDRLVENFPIASRDGAGFGTGAFDCVLELWASSFAALAATASLETTEFSDTQNSFSVFATEFPIHGTLTED